MEVEMDARTQELLDRLVALGQFPNMSCSEGHELYNGVTERLNDLEEEIARGSGRRKHTHEWYERHYGKLHDWARTILPEPFRNQFFSCIANGVYGHDDLGKPYKTVAGFMVTPSGYFKMESAQEQILFDQCVRAEDAEAENILLRRAVHELHEEIERLKAGTV